MRVIAVVFGASTPKERNAQITKMLDFAFSQYETHPMYKRNEIISDLKVNKGREQKINLVTSEPISLLTKKGENIESVKKEIKQKDRYPGPCQKRHRAWDARFEKGWERCSLKVLLSLKKIWTKRGCGRCSSGR